MCWSPSPNVSICLYWSCWESRLHFSCKNSHIFSILEDHQLMFFKYCLSLSSLLLPELLLHLVGDPCLELLFPHLLCWFSLWAHLQRCCFPSDFLFASAIVLGISPILDRLCLYFPWGLVPGEWCSFETVYADLEPWLPSGAPVSLIAWEHWPTFVRARW